MTVELSLLVVFWLFAFFADLPAETGSQLASLRIENEIISVTLDRQQGTLSVLDKRTGFLWAPAQSLKLKTPSLIIPQAPKPAQIDGQADDWTTAAEFRLTPDMTADAKDVRNEADLSAHVKLCWTSDALYLLAAVRDEKLQWCQPDEARWWECDTVEFWIGNVQCAFRPGDKETTFWSAGKAPEGIAAKTRVIEGGYLLEAKIPWKGLAAAPAAKLGERFPFALGVNDADSEGGKREGQLYFPATWEHSSPDSFAVAILGDPNGQAPDAATPSPAESAFTDVQSFGKGDHGFKFKARCPAPGGRTIEALVTLSVPNKEAEVVVDLDLPDRTQKISGFRLFEPLTINTPDAALLVARYDNGLAVPVTEPSWQKKQMTLGQLDLPWIGLTDGTKGYLVIGDTADDLDVRLDAVKCGETSILAPSVHCRDSKGEFRYPRRFRYRFLHEGGIVALAKAYRQFSQNAGLLKTLKEKMKKKPAVARLLGAPDIWGNASLDFCREAKAAGLDRAIVNGPSKAEDMEAIKALGYLISVYDNYEDCIEGRQNSYSDVKIPDDCPVLADGKPMQGWLTFDKKTQFMKRCSTPQLEVAKRWIPKDLEKHPYNARFLDVTTACGLRECYSLTHPLTRAEDREAKRALARYVGEELGLVLGGEHGRYWGADLYDYWEGMQSGGFYSWPAGHVGDALPKSREEIGKAYLEWGLGQSVRVPLWQLCFGDCVVSTWYWGDSTGHLFQVAPELDAKKDALNILYGTVPLYWVSRPFGFNWDKPELRARLLESYRNTCKLHEIIGFEEMVDFQYVTADRSVQQTRLSDGTVVTVNFGEEPFRLEVGKEVFLLPQYGFHARGPGILQYKALHEGRAITFIKTEDYAFGDGAGKAHDFGFVRTDGRVTLRKRDDGFWINAEMTQTPPLIKPSQLDRRWHPKNARLLSLNSFGEAEGYAAANHVTRETVSVPFNGVFKLVYSEAGLRPDLAVQAESVQFVPQWVKQGEPVEIVVQIANFGERVRDAEFALYVDGGQEESSKGLKNDNCGVKQLRNSGSLDEKRRKALTYQNCGVGQLRNSGTRQEDKNNALTRVDIAAGKAKTVKFRVETDTLDGTHRFELVADPENKISELIEVNNMAEVNFTVTPDFARWPGRIDLEVQAGDATYQDWPVGTTMDFSGQLAGRDLDLTSVRVEEVVEGQPGEMMVTQWESEAGSKGQVWWLMKGETKPRAVRRFALLFAPKGHGAFGAIRSFRWNEAALELTTPVYRARFIEGVIRDLTLRFPGAPKKGIWSGLVASSGETGWTEQEGKVTHFEILQNGPVRTVIAVGKDLPKERHYEKTYEFFDTHFVVTVEVNKPLIYSRAFYTLHGDYLDDKGLRARIDGAGEGDGVSGKNSNPQWYQVVGEGWAHSCVALTPFGNIAYWDSGGQIGFTQSPDKVCRVAYVFYGSPPTETFGAADAARLKSSPQVKVVKDVGGL